MVPRHEPLGTINHLADRKTLMLNGGMPDWAGDGLIRPPGTCSFNYAAREVWETFSGQHRAGAGAGPDDHGDPDPG